MGRNIEREWFVGSEIQNAYIDMVVQCPWLFTLQIGEGYLPIRDRQFGKRKWTPTRSGRFRRTAWCVGLRWSTQRREIPYTLRIFNELHTRMLQFQGIDFDVAS